MRMALTALCHTLDLPPVHRASVVAPDVTQLRESALYRRLYCVLRTAKLKAWNKQA